MLVGPVVSCIRSQGDGVPMMEPHQLGPPPAQGLYDPRHQRDKVQTLIQTLVVEEGQRFLGWRDLPTDDRHLGATARSVEPVMRQMFIGRGPGVRDHAHFERKLYVIRKRIENAVAAMDFTE